jgi:hypothetical protein
MLLLGILRWVATKVHNFLHNNTWAPHFVEVAGLVLAVFIGLGIYRHYQPTVTVTQVIPGKVETVTIDRPVLTDKLVYKVLPDPKDKAAIAALMAENAKLKLDVTALSQTLAELKQTGGGPVTTVPATTATADTPAAPVSYSYKDWHLNFSTDLKTAKYNLNQQFEVLTTTSKNKDGLQVAQTAVYELGPNGERIPATSVKTTGIFTDATTPHWMVHLNIQGGFAVTRDVAGAQSPGAIVALQWLQHGRTKATEDTTYAVASPAFFFGPKVNDIGVLPFSINLGRIPHQPLTNLWFSPFIAKDKRLGLVFTATF